MRARCIVFLIPIALSLAACGNKGQLVLPNKQPEPAKKSDPAKTDSEPKPKPADGTDSGHPAATPNAQ